MGVVSLTLHLKVKYPTQGRVRKLVGSQAMARQYLIAAITQQPAKSSCGGRRANPIAIKGSRSKTWDRVARGVVRGIGTSFDWSRRRKILSSGVSNSILGKGSVGEISGR